MSATPTTPSTPPIPPLEEHHFKKLLKHIKAAGGLAVVELKELCDNHKVDLGEPGTILRRQVQRKHDKLKNKWSATKYLATLKANQISASEVSEKAAFLETMAENEDTNGDTTNDEGTTNGGDTGEESVVNIIGDLDNLTVSMPPRIVRTPTRLPSSGTHRTPPPALAVSRGNGTKNNPFVLIYDISYPERSFPFIIKYQPSIVHENYEHQCFDIEMVVEALDMDDWEATIPITPVPGLEKRIVDVKGPSVPFFFRHQDDDDTDTEHKTLMQALEEDPSRKHLYWRIIFPANSLLNNDIFSKGRRLFEEHQPLTIKKNHDENEYDKDFHAALLHWRIALEGVMRQMISQANKSKKKDFFK